MSNEDSWGSILFLIIMVLVAIAASTAVGWFVVWMIRVMIA